MVDKEELLKEAKLRYPIGTKFKTIDYTLDEIVVVLGEYRGDDTPYCYCLTSGNIPYRSLYLKGIWAEIISETINDFPIW